MATTPSQRCSRSRAVPTAAGRRPARWLAALVALALLAAACTDDEPAAGGPDGSSAFGSDEDYAATIRWTTHGIPHIEAADLGSLAFGQGYAQASDHACTIADQVLKVRSERARYLGPGVGGANVDTDVAYLALGTYRHAQDRYSELGGDARAVLDGFAVGFNTWLDEVPAEEVPGWCSGASWIRPLTPVDLLAYLGDLAMLTGSRNLIGPIAVAQPPGSPALDTGVPTTASTTTTMATARTPAPAPGGAAAGDPAAAPARVAPTATTTTTTAAATSGTTPDGPAVGGPGPVPPPGASVLRPAVAGNAWAFGGDATRTGRGVLAANPQLPWEGELRLWEQQLTIPGELDVYGASLVGVPMVLIGFNEDLAWTHTVAAGSRVTLYALDLVPGEPTAYRFGDGAEEMTSRTFTVQVRQPDQTVAPVVRTLWASRHGPLLELPGLAWTEETAFAVRDATAEVDGFVDQWLDMARADSLDELVAAHDRHAATMWLDTLAVTADGDAWYGSAAATPSLSPGTMAAYDGDLADDPLTQAVAAHGAVLLDGADPGAQWQVVAGAAAPGLVPFADSPQRTTDGLLVTADHGHWAVDPGDPLTGYPLVFGAEEVPLSPRSRQALRGATELVDAAADDDVTVSAADVRELVLDNVSLTGEELRDEVVDRCRQQGSVRVPEQRDAAGELLWAGQEVDLGRACSALDDWDLHFDLDSKGAILWREALTRFDWVDLTDAGELFDQPFDPDDPVGTPRGLAEPPAEGEDPVLVALAEALLTMDEVGLPHDVALRDVQYAMRGEERLPVHGGHEADGTTNQVGLGGLSTTREPLPSVPSTLVPGSAMTADGEPVSGGSGFVLVVEFTDGGPVAEAMLAYGQSGDPTSPYYADQTYRFSDKAWRPARFAADDVAGDPNLTEQRISAPRPSS